MHLKDLSEGRSSILIDQVNHSLELPLHRRVRSLEVRWYIDSYENRKDANKVLLEAAKLNFNIVQSTLQQDLKEMSRAEGEDSTKENEYFTRQRNVIQTKRFRIKSIISSHVLMWILYVTCLSLKGEHRCWILVSSYRVFGSTINFAVY
ncbi:tricyclene synthase TPS4, chloroplastic-like [Medicago truncatula]|uniref:tricyclene synthase TPS4, chloroplastic-like n=1 Tax=Medicago truncatula TaxID=3880 RepID=UPI000D2F2E34|nr:tricyclene synthase TPS4, chloroplastic-like [Medicago truncatula]